MEALPVNNGHTIYDIAHRAGVGIATVSRVINGSDRVAEPTRLAVQRAMVELGFRPNHAARQLAVRGPNRPRVAALMPFFSANFYFSVSRPMSNGLASSKIDLLVYDIQNRDNKNRLLDQILQESVSNDGVSDAGLHRLGQRGSFVLSLVQEFLLEPLSFKKNIEGCHDED